MRAIAERGVTIWARARPLVGTAAAIGQARHNFPPFARQSTCVRLVSMIRFTVAEERLVEKTAKP